MAREIPPLLGKGHFEFPLFYTSLKSRLAICQKNYTTHFWAIEFASINATLLKSHSRFTVEGPKRSPVLALWIENVHQAIPIGPPEYDFGPISLM